VLSQRSLLWRKRNLRDPTYGVRRYGILRLRAIHPRVLPSFYLLSGILFCSCGSAITGHSAKSHQFYYYKCSRKLKEGSASCQARNLPKKKLEKVVTEHIKAKILDNDTLEKLVALGNQDLEKAHSSYREKLEVLDTKLKDVNSRLVKLYDALEMGKLELNDLAPSIKELKVRQDELLKSRVLLEADMAIHGVRSDVNNGHQTIHAATTPP
jgi:site-specific DNA recombinase